MHFKEDVLSQFKEMRSSERIDLICSLMDLCLPFELRFLGTCLEFLGKRDFYELREDERLANNVNHISQLRSLTDENTRRKLVLYVSLLKSCNSDCANCINDTLAGLCINDVNLCCRSDIESAAKIIDEFLLLYTIALKHPAFSIHQKSEFASLLALLQEEDRKFTLNHHSSKDLICKQIESSSSDYSDIQNQFQSSPTGAVDDVDSSSHISAKSQASPLTCHVMSGSSYTMDAHSPTLSQASTASLGATPVPDHPTTSPPNESKSLARDLVSIVGGETPLPMALPVAPVNSNLVMGRGMMVSASHCILPSPSLPSQGEMNMQKGSLGPHAVLIGVHPESIMHLPYPGHTPWAVVMPVPGPPAGPSAPSPPPVPETIPTPTSGAVPTSSSVCTPAAPPCATFSPAISNSSMLTSSSSISLPISASVESNSISDSCLNQYHSQPSSPTLSRDPTPTRQGRGSRHTKPVHQQPHSVHQQVLQPSQMLSHTTQSVILTSATPPMVHTFSVGQPPHCVNQSTTQHVAPPLPHPLLFPHQSQNTQQQSSPPGQVWDTPSDNLKDVIGREMPKYSSLQDYSPDELLHMSDDKLKEIGLSPSAIQQLRSIMGKLQVTNGITCTNRAESHFQNECIESRRRCQPVDSKMAMGIPPLVPGPGVGQPYGYMVPIPHTGIAVSNSSNGGNCIKGNHRQHHHQIVHQVRALQLEDDNRRPCSNSSSNSDCSSGSHSPPETPHNQQWDRGTWPTTNMHHRRMHDYGRRGSDHFRNNSHVLHSLQGVDLGEHWSYDRSREDRSQDDRGREDRLHEPERSSEGRGPSQQPIGLQRNMHNSRPRGLSKAPPGIPSAPRGRGHPLMDKSRRDGSGGPMNGVTAADASSFPMGASVPYTTPVASFLPQGACHALPAFQRFQVGNFLPHPASATYPIPSCELWSQFAGISPHQAPQFMAPIVAFSPAHPPPKLSCYNCGGQGHQGSDCKDLTFEEITHQGQYHLDYKPFKEPGDCRDSDK